MAAVERRQRPKVTARAHNAVVKAAQKRVDDLEPRLAEIIETILARAGTKAAARFQDKALRHFGASAANADVASTATMIALKPRPVEAAALADPDGDPPEILHVTLAYLGDSDQPLQEIADALKPVAALYAPLSGVVGGVGAFHPAGVGIVLPDVRGLAETRQAVVEALHEAGIDYGRDHGFTAHITISGDGEPPDESAGGQPLHFDSLHIVRGNDEEIALPLVGVRALTAAASWTPPYPDELIDVNALVAQILAKTEPVRKAMIEQTMTPALEQAGLSWDVSNPLTAQMLAVSASQVTNIAMTTRANLMKIIGSAYQNGLTVPQTAGLIRDGMKAASKVRSTMIARTELARAVNGGSLAATQLVASVTGQKYNKVWHTAPGARYPRHEDYAGLDGQTVPQDATFEVGGDQLQFPGDPNGEPGETINCRCTLTYAEVAAGEEAALQTPSDNQSLAGEVLGEVKRLISDETGAVELPKVKLPTAEPDVKTANVEEAAKALANGKTVQLTSTSIVNTFIDRLGAMAEEAQKAGKSAPNLDLARVGVKGTNLFTQDSLGIPRVEMPQLEGLPVPGSPASKLPTTMFEGKVSQWRDVSEPFFKSLQDQGVQVTHERVNPESLKATQSQLNGPKVATMMDDLETGVPIPENIVVSSDNYVLDGHHHWAAQIGVDYKSGLDVPHPMDVLRVDEPITTLLQQARDYAQEMGIPPQSAFNAAPAATAAPAVEAAPVPIPSIPVDFRQSVDIGITPFRADEDNAVGFYSSPKYQQFVSDAKESAQAYGVHIDGIDHATGVWQGDTEPSVSIRASQTEPDKTSDVYKGQHSAPGPDYGAPMDDLVGEHNGAQIYPKDVYDEKQQVHLYGQGGDAEARAMDQEAFNIVNGVKGDPSAMVTIYRGVPGDVTAIHPGDWVTPVKSYAEHHAEGNLGAAADGHVISMQVPASQLWTDGNSIEEWGWNPPDRAAFDAEARFRAFAANLGQSYNQDGVLLFTPSTTETIADAAKLLDGFKVEYEDFSYDFPPLKHPTKVGKLMKVTDRNGDSLGHFDFYTKPSDPDHVYVGLLALDKKFEGQGYARAMLARLSTDLKLPVVHGNFSTLEGVRFGVEMAARNPDWNLLELSEKDGKPVFWKPGTRIDPEANAFDPIPLEQRDQITATINDALAQVPPTTGGDSLMATFHSTLPQDKVVAAMKKAGIHGGRFTVDGRLQVIGTGPDFAKQLVTLGTELGDKYDVARGTFDLMERDKGDYRKALDAFSHPKGVTAANIPSQEEAASVELARGSPITGYPRSGFGKDLEAISRLQLPLQESAPQQDWIDKMTYKPKSLGIDVPSSATNPRDVVAEYTQDGSHDINHYLSGRTLPNSELEQYENGQQVEENAKAMQQIVGSAPPLPEGTTLYRGINSIGVNPALREQGNAAAAKILDKLANKWGLRKLDAYSPEYEKIFENPQFQKEHRKAIKDSYNAVTKVVGNWAAREYPVGSYVAMSEPGEFESMTLNPALAANFGPSAGQPSVVFRVLNAKTGAPIFPFSTFTDESEVLAPPDTFYRVRSVELRKMDIAGAPPELGKTADKVVVTIEEAPKCSVTGSLTAATGVACTDFAQHVPKGEDPVTVGSGDLFPGQDKAVGEHAANRRDYAIQNYAAANGMSPEEYKAAAEQAVKSYIAAHPQVRVRVTRETLEKILDDGRFKSEFELPGVTPDMVESRAYAEKNLFGYSTDMTPSRRPIYGYLAGTANESDVVSEYGELILNLDPAVNARSTFTIGDSYRAAIKKELSPSLLGSPGIGSWDGSFDIVKAFREGGIEAITRYVEVEIHDGLLASDIGGVTPDYSVIRAKEAAERLTEAIQSITEIAANYEGTQLESQQVEQAGIPTDQPTSLDFSKALRDMAKNAAHRNDILSTLISSVGLHLRTVESVAGLDEALAKATL
jgi:hypothetical protein